MTLAGPWLKIVADLRVGVGENVKCVLMRLAETATGAAFGLTVCVLAVVVCLFGSQRASAAPAVQHLGCGQRAESSAPTVFNDPRDKGRATVAFVGPLELHGPRSYASPRVFSHLARRNGYFIAKVALVLRAGRSVLLKLGGVGPDSVLLAYGSGAAPASELRIDSCAADTPARTRSGLVGSGTIFTGVFELTAAQCVNVGVTDRATMRVWRLRLPFGRTCSP